MKIKIKKINPISKFFCLRKYNVTLEINGKCTNWFRGLRMKFSIKELEALYNFAKENEDKLPYELVDDLRVASIRTLGR